MHLAVANDTETLERLRDPLREYGVHADHVSLRGTATDLTDPARSASGDSGGTDADGAHGVADFDAGFVFPGRLPEGGVLDALLDVPWLNTREDILTSRNKAAVIARLDGAGLPVPRTVHVSHPTDTAEIAAAAERIAGATDGSLDAPVVVKPNSTTRGVGVTKLHDTDSVLGVTDYLDLVHDYRATADKTFLLQEYLSDATDYRVMVLDGRYAGAVERKLPDGASGWKHNVHRGAEAEPVDLDPALRALAEDVADALDIPLLGVDLLVTDDRAVVTETNARPTVDHLGKYEPDFLDRLVGLLRDLE